MSEEINTAKLTFKLDEEIFAVPVEQVMEIIEVSQITKIPQTPEYIRGVTNLRGNVLPVIETRMKFGMPSIKDTIDTCIIVMAVQMHEEEIQLGVLVDAVMEVTQFETNQIKDKPNIGKKYKSEFITGIANSDDRFILLLDVNKVFSSDEIIQINEITEEEFA